MPHVDPVLQVIDAGNQKHGEPSNRLVPRTHILKREQLNVQIVLHAKHQLQDLLLVKNVPTEWDSRALNVYLVNSVQYLLMDCVLSVYQARQVISKR